MFFYPIVALILVFFQSFLILTTPINLYPEIPLFTYLVKKDLLPYRDFFDHHGFLLYYFFSFLSFDKNFIYYFYLIYCFIQFLNLILFLTILKESNSKSVFLIFGLFFVLLNYFFSDQTLWYENFVLFFYLLIYLIIIKCKKDNFIKFFLLGLLSFLSSLIKPTAGVILLPIVIFNKSLLVPAIFIFGWLVVFLFFYLKKSFFQIINSLFLFNLYLGKNYPREKIFDFQLIFVILFLLFFSLFVIFKKRQINKIIFLLLVFISSLIFPFLKYARYHMVPITPFLLLIIMKGYIIDKKKLGRFFQVVTLIFLFFLILKIKNQYFFNQKRIIWQNNLNYKALFQLKKMKIGDKKILIIGNHGEFYVYLNKIPLTYFPLVFNFVPQYFSFFYDDYKKAISQSDFLLIFPDDDSGRVVLKNKKIKELVRRNFKKIINEKDYVIYIKN